LGRRHFGEAETRPLPALQVPVSSGDDHMKFHTFAAAACALALGSIGVAAAQSETDRLWPTFDVAIGSYQVSADDEIRVEGTIERLGQDVDLSSDFGLPDRKSVFGGNFHWAFADKHSLGFSTYTLKRDQTRSIERVIEIGDTTFPIGASASLEFKQTFIEATYDYWFLRQEQFGLGGSVGLVYLSLDAEASASIQVGSAGQTISDRASASTDLPVPMIGLVTKGSPWPWLVLRAEARYLPSVTIDKYSGEAASYAVGADFYVWGPLAVGAAYRGTYYKADVEDSGWNGSIDVSNSGGELYLRASF
jgi:hypothetical protein